MIPTPTPTPTSIDPDLVTPGWIGFAITALLILAVIGLIFDMVRRMRRVRYREEARDRIAAELDARIEGTADGSDARAADAPDDEDPEDTRR